MLQNSYSMDSLKKEIQNTLKNLSLGEEPKHYKYILNARQISRNAVYNLANEIQSLRNNGGNIAVPYSPMIDVVMAVEHSETNDLSLIRTYYAVRKAIYSHQAAYINSEGYFKEFNKIYDRNSLSDRTKRLIQNKERQQLQKDTEYLRLKLMITPLDIRYATDAYQKYLIKQQNNENTQTNKHEAYLHAENEETF